MNIAVDVEEDTKEVGNAPKLRLLQGGKGPSEPPGDSHDWLSELDVGTTFTCRSKQSQEVDLNLYHIQFKNNDVILLVWRLPDGKMLDYYVDPKRFSKKNEHVTILGTQPVADEEQENERNPDRHSDVVLYETMPRVDQVVPEAGRPDLPD